ncbi:kinase-like protein [Pholiota conissans]|uniref:non-specific serine/threonine protein kinase n=1 Tax=Pholiota conissans TaxID=109636 RepID=A0A9P6CWQ9_9AGAR|nr:kinase-like protein [Pholiota conissans]
MDLKPANIFLTAERHCVIGDFGGSVLCSDETGVGIPARMQTFTTAGYRAPEVATYHQPRPTFQRFDHKADFWSLGVCMYAMLVALPDMRAINRKDHNNYQVLGLDATTMITKLDEICYKPEHSKRKVEEYSDMKRLILGMTTYNARVRMGFDDIVTFLAQRGQYFERRSPSPLLWVQPKNSVTLCVAHPAEPGDYLPAQEVVKELKTYVQLVCGRELVVYPA